MLDERCAEIETVAAALAPTGPALAEAGRAVTRTAARFRQAVASLPDSTGTPPTSSPRPANREARGDGTPRAERELPPGSVPSSTWPGTSPLHRPARRDALPQRVAAVSRAFLSARTSGNSPVASRLL